MSYFKWWLGSSFLAVQCLFVHAQIYKFEDVPVPDAKSLHTMYAFYVYSHLDAPEKGLGQPFVKFKGLIATPTPGKTPKDIDYKSLQLSVIPYEAFWRLIDPTKFCASDEDKEKGFAEESDVILVQKREKKSDGDLTNGLYSHTVPFKDSAIADHMKDVEVPVRSTGVYILVFSNCGTTTDATVGGTVVVKNAYGFLPGNDYHKLPFYGWLSVCYAVLALMWMLISFRYWRELFNIQGCITIVIFLGLLEAFFWWMFYNDWNTSGLRGTFLFVIAILSSVVKSIFSYMLLLVASLGWGVTRPYLDHRIILKIQAITFFYIVLDFIREAILSFRHSHTLSIAFVLLCLLPVSLLNGGIFYWIFTALSSLIETLKERKQVEKLVLFQRLWKLLVFSLATASFTLLFEIFDLSRSITIRWKYQWFLADGASHIIFLLILSVMMFLWAPTSNSKRYAYTQAGNKEDLEDKTVDNAQAVWATEEDNEDEGDDTFWATTHGKASTGIAPEEVGSLA